MINASLETGLRKTTRKLDSIKCPVCEKPLPIRKSKDGRLFTDINHIQNCVSLLEEERSNERCGNCLQYGHESAECSMTLEP